MLMLFHYQQKKKASEFETANNHKGQREIIVMKSTEQNPLLEARAKVKKGLFAYAVNIVCVFSWNFG